MSVLVYVENTDGEFKKSAFEVVSYARSVANKTNSDVVAISIGPVNQDALANLGKFGASKVLNVSADKLKTFANGAYASVIAQAARSEHATIIILSNSFSGKGLAPRISVKLQAGLATGVIDLPSFDGDKLTVKRAAFSGKAFAFVQLLSEYKIITLNPNSFAIHEVANTARVEDFQVETDESDFKTVVKEIVRATDKVALPEAELVVSGGRGMKAPENWKIIEDLAEALGAATACSKPVSDAGWRPHEEHVGQTGISVSPNLYIAVGISGAIQHLAGVSSSKTIVVINKDPDAPFFKVADYGIVGDALEIVPRLTEAVKKYKSQS